MTIRRVLVAALAVAGLIGGCSSGEGADPGPTTTTVGIDPPLPNGLNSILYRVGDNVALGDWQLAVLRSVPVPARVTRAARPTLVAYELQVRNGATRTQQFRPEVLRMYSSAGLGATPIAIRPAEPRLRSGATAEIVAVFPVEGEDAEPGALLFDGQAVYGKRVGSGLIALDPDYEPPPADA